MNDEEREKKRTGGHIIKGKYDRILLELGETEKLSKSHIVLALYWESAWR